MTRRHPSESVRKYRDASDEIESWVAVVDAARWHNFTEVRAIFKDADYVNGYVVFNIRRNRYRMITVIHYAKTTREKQTGGHVYIRSFLTQKEYANRSNWDRRFGSK